VHAITSGDSRTYKYDLYGNVTQRGSDTLEYETTNKPTKLGNTYFYYGPDRVRYKQVNSTNNITTYYFNDREYEEIYEGSTKIQRTYVDDVLVRETKGGAVTTTYLHYDHLGSTEAMTNASGAYIERMSFEPWGERQQDNWQAGNPTTGLPLFYPTQKGFTGHEHIDQLELIHMNGRVYDPTVGRFISPDPYIQEPNMSQSFNRYSYVWNNPLRYTDPTGEIVFILVIIGAIKLVGAASAVYGAWETGQSIGNGINDVASGEKSAIALTLIVNPTPVSLCPILFSVRHNRWRSVEWFIPYSLPIK
jgi:RHS repeat-associated protein